MTTAADVDRGRAGGPAAPRVVGSELVRTGSPPVPDFVLQFVGVEVGRVHFQRAHVTLVGERPLPDDRDANGLASEGSQLGGEVADVVTIIVSMLLRIGRMRPRARARPRAELGGHRVDGPRYRRGVDDWPRAWGRRRRWLCRRLERRSGERRRLHLQPAEPQLLAGAGRRVARLARFPLRRVVASTPN